MRPGTNGSRGIALLAVVVSALSGARAAPAPAELDALWALWRAHEAAPTNHPPLARAAADFVRRFSTSELCAVARGLGAWHALRAGATNDAVALWTALLAADATPLERAGQAIARAWLTRLDREAVRVALREHYARHALFPPTLQPLRELPAERRPPLTDRFGDAWQYSLDGYRHVPGTRGHRYRLISPRLGEELSDLRAALARPYGGGRTPPRPLRRIGSAVQFELGSDRPAVTEGASIGP